MNRTSAIVVAAVVVVVGLGCAAAVFFQPKEKPYPVSQAQRERSIANRKLAATIEKPAAIAPVVANDPPVVDKPADASTDRPFVSNGSFTPVDLSKHVSLKAANFEKVTRYPWKAMPHGPQTFANVPLQIDGAIFLWGERNAKAGMKYPEKIAGIPVDQKFESLYVCHSAFFQGETGLPVFEVVFHYEDGTSASDKILSVEDSRDWYATAGEASKGPTSPRSTLAWYGEPVIDEKVQPIRLCLTAIKNPHPELAVTVIDLVSCKTQSAGCVVAITTGTSGLMKSEASPETPVPANP